MCSRTNIKAGASALSRSGISGPSSRQRVHGGLKNSGASNKGPSEYRTQCKNLSHVPEIKDIAMKAP